MLWESWVLLFLFIGGLVTSIGALTADLHDGGDHHAPSAAFRLELSTGSTYPMVRRQTHGRHRAGRQARRWRR
ncbi:hypothetical protein [Nocardia sp. NBC_01388]|uniref:hypothetical protein n=1 Tax=Nocardia sp. NBC_01388 TaxID=2903596 RepID=UPI0032554FCE